MYEDINQIAQLKFNKEMELISDQTREKVKEMQQEYASLAGSSVGRSGQQDASIGRAQIDGAERLVRALYQIWVDLIEQKKSEISRPDIAFIASKIASYALTQKGHLRKAFSTQRMGAVVNLLAQEAEMRMHAVVANLRRDLEIMVRENEAFPNQIAQLPPDLNSSVADTTKIIPSPGKTIWTQMWSWVVVGAVDLFVLAGGIAFMTSGHAWAADGLLGAGTVLFLAKFWTWEDARMQSPLAKWTLRAVVTAFCLGLALCTIAWNHAINQGVPNSHSGQTTAGEKQATTTDSVHDSRKDLPSPASKTGKRTITIEERVKIIISGQLQVELAQIKPDNDFEVDLGANPGDVYFLMRSLEQEYDITIPPADSKNLHTVGETIAYIEMRERRKQ